MFFTDLLFSVIEIKLNFISTNADIGNIGDNDDIFASIMFTFHTPAGKLTDTVCVYYYC